MQSNLLEQYSLALLDMPPEEQAAYWAQATQQANTPPPEIYGPPSPPQPLASEQAFLNPYGALPNFADQPPAGAIPYEPALTQELAFTPPPQPSVEESAMQRLEATPGGLEALMAGFGDALAAEQAFTVPFQEKIRALQQQIAESPGLRGFEVGLNAYGQPEITPKSLGQESLMGLGQLANSFSQINQATNVPYLSDFLRNTVRPAAGDVGEFLDPSGLGIGRAIGEGLVPTTGLEMGFELLPGVGMVPGTVSAARSGATALKRAGTGALARALEPDVAGGIASVVRATGLPYGAVPEPVSAFRKASGGGDDLTKQLKASLAKGKPGAKQSVRIPETPVEAGVGPRPPATPPEAGDELRRRLQETLRTGQPQGKPAPGELKRPQTTDMMRVEGLAPKPPATTLRLFKKDPALVQKGTLEAALTDLGALPQGNYTKAQLARRLERALKEGRQVESAVAPASGSGAIPPGSAIPAVPERAAGTAGTAGPPATPPPGGPPVGLQGPRMEFPEGGRQAGLPGFKAGIEQDASLTDELTALAGLPRTLKASFDLSAPGRQGLALAFRHPKEWIGSWVPMIKAWASDEGMQAVNRNIDNIMAKWPTDAVHFYEVGPSAPGLERVPGFEAAGRGKIASVVRRIPGLKNSERAYATFLNYQKAKTFDTMASSLREAGETKGSVYEGLGRIIDHATGYGAAPFKGRIEGQAFFSQRYMTSRLQFLTDPIIEGLAKGDLRTARAATENLVAFAGGMAGLLYLGDEAGAWDAQLDPRSSDFGKIRLGPQRIDFGAGFLPLIRTIARVSTGEAKSAAGRVYDIRRDEEVLKFFRNKLAPLPSGVISRIVGENVIGEKPGKILSLQTVGDLFMPLIADSVLEAYRTTKDPATAARAGLAELVGGGVSTYKTATEGSSQQVLEDVKAGLLPATYIGTDGTEQPLTDYQQLTREQQQAFDERNSKLTQERQESASPAIQQLRSELEVYSGQQQQFDELPYGQAWRDARGSNQDQKRGAVDAVRREHQDYFDELSTKEPTNLEDVVLRDWGSAIDKATHNGLVDWLSVDREIAGWSPQAREELERSRLASGTPKEREYLADIAKLRPYFEAADRSWEELARANPDFAPYRNFEEFQSAEIKAAIEANPNAPVPVIEKAVARALAPIGRAGSVAGLVVLAENLALVDLLVKHGFYVPSSLAPAASPGAGR